MNYDLLANPPSYLAITEAVWRLETAVKNGGTPAEADVAMAVAALATFRTLNERVREQRRQLAGYEAGNRAAALEGGVKTVWCHQPDGSWDVFVFAGRNMVGTINRRGLEVGQSYAWHLANRPTDDPNTQGLSWCFGRAITDLVAAWSKRTDSGKQVLAPYPLGWFPVEGADAPVEADFLPSGSVLGADAATGFVGLVRPLGNGALVFLDHDTPPTHWQRIPTAP